MFCCLLIFLMLQKKLCSKCKMETSVDKHERLVKQTLQKHDCDLVCILHKRVLQLLN